MRTKSSLMLILIPALLFASVLPSGRMTNFVQGQRGTVLIFVSSMCPCTDQHKGEVRQLMEITRSRGISYYCIFSNITENDSRIGQFFRNVNWEMPYVHDQDGRLAKKFGATHTPQVILLDANGTPVYRGPIDDSNKNLGRIEHAYLRDDVMNLLSGESMTYHEVPPMGCWLVTSADVQK